MNRLKTFLTAALALTVVLAVAPPPAVAADGPATRIRLKDGSTWRGHVGDAVTIRFVEQGVEIEMTGTLKASERLYLILETELAGETKEKTVFLSDVVAVADFEAEAEVETDDRPVRKPTREGQRDLRNAPRIGGSASARDRNNDDIPRDDMGRPLGVFVLPLEGMVGDTFRHQEILELGEHADTFGPGQIIVLLINSNGGLVLESIEINDAIHEVRKRHRVVAWLDKAISAGASTAMACEEIYFRNGATCGSVTTLAGGRSLSGAEAEEHVADFVKMATKSGYSEHIARAMKLNKYMCSYDKDPETGEVTFYGDLSGEFVLSDANSNLGFNADDALHCGFSRGTADTEDELAKHLGLPKWYEIDDYGRRIAEDWVQLVEKCKDEVPRLMQRMSYKNTSTGDPIKIMGTRMGIIRDLIRWWDRCERPMMLMGVPPKEQLERTLEEMKRELARMRRR